MIQINPLAHSEERRVQNLQLHSTLRDLKAVEFQVDETCIGEELFRIFQRNTRLPGAIFIRQGVLTGLISRARFLEIISRPFGRELFLSRSLGELYNTNPCLRENLMVLPADLPIFEAVKICLQRPFDSLYEPIVVDIGQQTYQILALQDLLVNQTQIYQVAMLTIEERTADLARANVEISMLNEKLESENLRMGAELSLLKQMQQMILPKAEELEIEGLDIAGFMEPADEVGGDYYDVLQTDGVVTIAMGDVTGHGLESGILMLMAQTAVRTLKEVRERDPVRFLDTLNRTIYKNVRRMDSDKNLTLVLLNYIDRKVSISGQHEETIVVRNGGYIERIDTIDLGFPIGLDDNIANFINHTVVELYPGDSIVLYTDGITEASNIHKNQYGLQQLCDVVSQNWQRSANEIKQAVIEDVRRHIGSQKIFDDITLLVLKQRGDETPGMMTFENGSIVPASAPKPV
ncbi:SpoIIE family protein phosphatase [Leptolyngbya sp. 'hensonii']|uniref:PP2C family protein-serine/threonine phosphatase n=1 Tax=Leptolyngbya sp. 'hensonii' TaxID=1922337 RepID=UPI0009F8E91F|nr:SpoIIE family protein phosphatase [Leptolyngbya sp. 'hensonii']